MKRTLLIKVILGYIIFGLASFIFVANFSARYNLHEQERQFAADSYREATLIANNYGDVIFKDEESIQSFQREMNALAEYLDGVILIVNPQGEILVDSRKVTDPEQLEQLEGFDILEFGNSYVLKSDFFGHFDQPMQNVYRSITSNYRLRGYVIISVPMSRITNSQNDWLNGNYMTMLIIFGMSFIVLFIFVLWAYRPIRALTKVAADYNQGKYDSKVQVGGHGEMHYIGETMNYMAHELNTLEEEQRKFISNVSHDFRSPLTSIRGYAEAMADGTIPVEMQEKYLNIIVYESTRLEKLTQSILDLNKYGKRGLYMDYSDFDINETVRRTVQTFEGVSREKLISFELILAGQELFVHADEAKIDQVLHNLIDNAIKFSKTDSTIIIETTERKGKVAVSVKDTGIGIPKDSIKKIWDRFYKTDLSRGKDKKGTGLGLSIVKEIISAHEENIDVISTEGVGTEFIFTLQAANR